MVTSRVFLEAGQRFGRGVVVDPEIRLPLSEGKKRSGSKMGPRGALMRCDCGTEYKAIIGNLTAGSCQSCGCRLREARAEAGRRNIKHGLSKHPNFPRWRSMVNRCHKPTNPSYESYGGRGITVCPEWHDPSAFVAYLDAALGPCPDGYSLDRIDNDGNYEPGNIRWADSSTQRRNQRQPGAPKKRRTHCYKDHEFTPQNTIRTRQGRRCRTCRNESELSRSRAARRRERDTQAIPRQVLQNLVAVAERAMATDPQAREALEALEVLGLYDMPIDVTFWQLVSPDAADTSPQEKVATA